MRSIQWEKNKTKKQCNECERGRVVSSCNLTKRQRGGHRNSPLLATIRGGGGLWWHDASVTCATRRCLRWAASRGLCVRLAWTESCSASVPHLPAPPPAPEWSPAQQRMVFVSDCGIASRLIKYILARDSKILKKVRYYVWFGYRRDSKLFTSWAMFNPLWP